MKKIFLLIIVILFSLAINSFNASSAICTGAQVCNEYDIDCKFDVKDGFCPEKYGDWSQCEKQSFGKCAPCDPDCGICGNIDLTVQSLAKPCETIDALVTANLDKTPDTIQLLKGSDLSGTEVQTSKCNEGEKLCKRTFKYTVSCTEGATECLTATTSNLRSPAQDAQKVTKCIQIVKQPSIFASEVLNTVYLRIKSWIT